MESEEIHMEQTAQRSGTEWFFSEDGRRAYAAGGASTRPVR